ncbi:recombinase family protein [Enterococcus casseliflavus]|uniref:recombinase family protein n=1 Tax=Enterococcus casseliflavus TaxID=37734 RepID=UPI003D2FDA16
MENTHYIGDLVQQRETTISITTEKRKRNNPADYVVIESTHKVLISKDDFYLAQQLMNERKRKRPHVKRHLFWLYNLWD